MKRYLIAFVLGISSVALADKPQPQRRETIDTRGLIQNPRPWFFGSNICQVLIQADGGLEKNQWGRVLTYDQVLEIEREYDAFMKKLKRGRAVVKADCEGLSKNDQYETRVRFGIELRDPWVDELAEKFAAIVGPEIVASLHQRVKLDRLREHGHFGVQYSTDYPEFVALWQAVGEQEEFSRFVDTWRDEDGSREGLIGDSEYGALIAGALE